LWSIEALDRALARKLRLVVAADGADAGDVEAPIATITKPVVTADAGLLDRIAVRVSRLGADDADLDFLQRFAAGHELLAQSIEIASAGDLTAKARQIALNEQSAKIKERLKTGRCATEAEFRAFCDGEVLPAASEVASVEPAAAPPAPSEAEQRLLALAIELQLVDPVRLVEEWKAEGADLDKMYLALKAEFAKPASLYEESSPPAPPILPATIPPAAERRLMDAGFAPAEIALMTVPQAVALIGDMVPFEVPTTPLVEPESAPIATTAPPAPEPERLLLAPRAPSGLLAAWRAASSDERLALLVHITSGARCAS